MGDSEAVLKYLQN